MKRQMAAKSHPSSDDSLLASVCRVACHSTSGLSPTCLNPNTARPNGAIIRSSSKRVCLADRCESAAGSSWRTFSILAAAKACAVGKSLRAFRPHFVPVHVWSRKVICRYGHASDEPRLHPTSRKERTGTDSTVESRPTDLVRREAPRLLPFSKL